jgi:hypothetical protein
MRGSFNILGKVNNLDPSTSSYMAVFKGLNPKQSTITRPIDLTQSFISGGIVPDPVLYKNLRQRQEDTL